MINAAQARTMASNDNPATVSAWYLKHAEDRIREAAALKQTSVKPFDDMENKPVDQHRTQVVNDLMARGFKIEFDDADEMVVGWGE